MAYDEMAQALLQVRALGNLLIGAGYQDHCDRPSIAVAGEMISSRAEEILDELSNDKT